MVGSFALFEIVFAVVFILILAVILISVVRLFITSAKNDAAPVLTVGAAVYAKRESKTMHRGNADMYGQRAVVGWYITFEFSTGSRIELSVPLQEYGYVHEGDRG